MSARTYLLIISVHAQVESSRCKSPSDLMLQLRAVRILNMQAAVGPTRRERSCLLLM